MVGGDGWNVDLVRSPFSEEEAEAILSIPVGRLARADSWAWKYTPKGNFSVSSAYQVASRSLIERYTSSQLDSETWMLLWNLDVPSKIRVFLWRACREILPTTDALRGQRCNIEDGCKGCGMGT